MYDSASGVSHSHVSWMTYLNLDYMDKNTGPPTYHASAMETHCIVGADVKSGKVFYGLFIFQ